MRDEISSLRNEYDREKAAAFAEWDKKEIVEHARGLEIDNLRLRMKLQAISSIVGDEVYVEDMFIPDDEFADIDIPEAEGECRMPSV